MMDSLDNPVVVDSVRSLMKTIRSLLEMVWQDLQVERANKVIISNRLSQVIVSNEPSRAIVNKESRQSAFKYHPADW